MFYSEIYKSLFILLIINCFLISCKYSNDPGKSKEPEIDFTFVPDLGDISHNLEGIVYNVDPSQFKVVVYIKVNGVWWVKPYSDLQFRTTDINDDYTWECDIVTGGNDQDASEISAFLISYDYEPPNVLGGSLLPIELYESSLDYASVVRTSNDRKLIFSGYEWKVKAGSSKIGPGPNYFSDSEDNVWVDDEGYLHLKIINRNGNWHCSEIISTESFGFGKYVFYLNSYPEFLDQNVVIGFFTWDDDPAFNHREIDIEFSKWKETNGLNSQYVIQPYTTDGNRYRFDTYLTQPDSVHLFEWKENEVIFSSFEGDEINSALEINSYVYNGLDTPIPGNENVRLNLWLIDGFSPVDHKEVEVIIEKFKFIR